MKMFSVCLLALCLFCGDLFAAPRAAVVVARGRQAVVVRRARVVVRPRVVVRRVRRVGAVFVQPGVQQVTGYGVQQIVQNTGYGVQQVVQQDYGVQQVVQDTCQTGLALRAGALRLRFGR